MQPAILAVFVKFCGPRRCTDLFCFSMDHEKMLLFKVNISSAFTIGKLVLKNPLGINVSLSKSYFLKYVMVYNGVALYLIHTIKKYLK